MSRRALLHARLDRRIVEGKTIKGTSFRLATPGSASDFRALHGIRSGSFARSSFYLTTSKKADPNNPEWLASPTSNLKQVSVRRTRALRALHAAKLGGAVAAKLWLRRADGYVRIVEG